MDRMAQLEAAGATLIEVDMPLLEVAAATYYVVTSAEAASNLGRFDGVRYGPREAGKTPSAQATATRSALLGPEVQRRILLGTFSLSEGHADQYIAQATAVRHALRAQVDKVLGEADAIVTPTSPTVAWPLGARMDDPLAMYLSDIHTVTASLTGHPAISVPAGATDGLPVGLHFAGRMWDEATLFALGGAVS
jgi:aspartyl-tRNA(Asn)/glutamyl-tRNA(Gln) amidotransferase subunit A